jgi:site-specific recombinase XerD
MAGNIRRARKTEEYVKRRDRSMSVSVLEAVTDYLNTPHVKGLMPGTKRQYDMDLRCFANWCDSHAFAQNKKSNQWEAIDLDEDHHPIQLHQINENVVQCFIEHVKATHKPSKHTKTEVSTYTLSRYVQSIKTFLNWYALDDQYGQYVQLVIVQRIEKPTVVETVLETFSREQINALFKACDKEESEHLQLRDKAILALLFDTGLRADELVKLTIGNVFLDPQDPHVRVLGKGRKWGEVGFGEQTRRHVQKYVRLYREPTVTYQVEQKYADYPAKKLKQMIDQEMQQAHVFVNRYGKHLTVSGLESLFERLGNWANIQGVRCSPHSARHTFAQNFILNGGDIYRLSKLLRHSSVAVTEHYLKSLKQSEARRGTKSLVDDL